MVSLLNWFDKQRVFSFDLLGPPKGASWMFLRMNRSSKKHPTSEVLVDVQVHGILLGDVIPIFYKLHPGDNPWNGHKPEDDIILYQNPRSAVNTQCKAF